VWVVEIIQNAGYEGPVEINLVPNSHVGCEKVGISCGCSHSYDRYRGYLLLNRLSRHGSRVTLTSSRGGGETTTHYINEHCGPGTQKHSSKVAIRDV
jgi:hypothetical protein